jgi:hypothetical protein
MTFLIFSMMIAVLTPAWADTPYQATILFPLPMKWTPVPGTMGVQYAPESSYDIFLYGGSYYCFQNGLWYVSATARISWGQTTSIPQIFYQIPANCFKRPPGWAKGNKTGWKGSQVPPGQRNR